MSKIKYYNNGEIIIGLHDYDNIPDGFVRGRGKFSIEHRHKLSKSHKNQKPWNIGLTKDTDERVKKYSNSISIAQKGVKKGPQSEEHKLHVIEAKIKNKSFNTSKPEEDYYKYLCSIYGEHDIIRQYKCDKYPFLCDFYIISEDKFIEINFYKSHGGKPFDENDEECLEQLNDWLVRAKNKPDYYNKIINVWTLIDVKKLKTFRDNKLNFEIIYPTFSITE